MRIGVDCDNVIYPFADIFRLYCEDVMGRHLPTPTVWNFEKEWDLSIERFHRLLRRGHDRGIVFSLGAPPKTAIDVLGELRHAHEVVIVTARPAYSKRATLAWLDHWEIPRDDLVFADDKAAVDIDVLIDDSPLQIEAARAAGKVGIVFDQPWNWNAGGPYVSGWSDVPLAIYDAANELGLP